MQKKPKKKHNIKTTVISYYKIKIIKKSKMNESKARQACKNIGIPWNPKGKNGWEKWNKDVQRTKKFQDNFIGYTDYLKSMKFSESAQRQKNDAKTQTTPIKFKKKNVFFSNTSKTNSKSNLSPLASTLISNEDEDEHEHFKHDAQKKDASPESHEIKANTQMPAKKKESTIRNKIMSSPVKEKIKPSDLKSKSKYLQVKPKEPPSSNIHNNDDDVAKNNFRDSIDKKIIETSVSMSIQAIQENNLNSPTTLVQLKTKEGQLNLLNQLNECCMKKIHDEYQKTMRNEKNLLPISCIDECCQHFVTAKNKHEYNNLLQLHNQLKCSLDDDCVSEVISQCAEEAFDEIVDISINAYEMNKDDKTSPFKKISDDAAENMDITTISRKDLDAINHNYLEISANIFASKLSSAFAIWGNSALHSSKYATLSKAQKIVNQLINWINNGYGSRYEGDIYLGYQSSVAILILIISQMPSNYSSEQDISKISELAKRLLEMIQTSHSIGSIDKELLKYEIIKSPPVKRGKRGKLKKYTRRVFKKTVKLTTTSELKFLKDIIEGSKMNYENRLAIKRAEQIGSIVSIETKNEIAREMLDDYLMNRARQEAFYLFKAIRGLSLGSTTFDILHMTMRVMAITCAEFLTRKSQTYGGFSSQLVANNLINSGGILPEALEALNSDIMMYTIKLNPKGMKKLAKDTNKQRKKHLKIKTPQIVLSSNIPSLELSQNDKLLNHDEKKFVNSALHNLFNYVEYVNTKKKRNKNWKDANIGDEPKNNLEFVVVIPEERKMRNKALVEHNIDYSHNFVFEKKTSETKARSSRLCPVVNEEWLSLPDSFDVDWPKNMHERNKRRFYINTNRLEPVEAISSIKTNTHSTYVDSNGKIMRLRVKRVKPYIHVSHPFKLRNYSTNRAMKQHGSKIPNDVKIYFVRSFG